MYIADCALTFALEAQEVLSNVLGVIVDAVSNIQIRGVHAVIHNGGL